MMDKDYQFNGETDIDKTKDYKYNGEVEHHESYDVPIFNGGQ